MMVKSCLLQLLYMMMMMVMMMVMKSCLLQLLYMSVGAGLEPGICGLDSAFCILGFGVGGEIEGDTKKSVPFLAAANIAPFRSVAAAFSYLAVAAMAAAARRPRAIRAFSFLSPAPEFPESCFKKARH
jgi:hypothetical protein